MARYKRRKKLQLTMIECILLVIGGLLMGTSFTFGMQFWNAAISQEDAISVTAEYTEHEIEYGRRRRTGTGRRIKAVDLYFADHEQLTIDGYCADSKLMADLDALRKGTVLDLLVHPNSDTILSISAPEGSLLTFEDAIKRLSFEKWGFFGLGLFAYVCAGIGAYYLIARKYY